MAISRVKTWSNGEVLTHTDLNAEFNNILNNATSLISPLTANLAAGNFDLTGVGNIAMTSGGDITNLDELALLSAGAAASATGRLRNNAGTLLWHDGTASRTVALNAVTAWNFTSVAPSVDYTNATAAYTTITGYSVSITTNGGSVLVIANGPGHCTAGDTGRLTLGVDAVDQAILVTLAAGGQTNLPWVITKVFTPTAGAHTYTVRGKTDAAAATLTVNTASQAVGHMIVVELRD